MALDGIIGSLLRVPLFAGLSPLQITEVARRAARCAFEPGEVIIRAGDLGDSAFLVLSGEAGSKVRGASGAQPVEPGSLLGELAMLVDHVYGVTVTAESWVDCLKLERAVLETQMQADPDMARRIAGVISGRLTQVAAELQVIDGLLTVVVDRFDQIPRALPRPAAMANLTP